jgi:hypothetical protein
MALVQIYSENAPRGDGSESLESKGATMKPEGTVINHVLDVIAHAPGCRIEHVARFLPDFTLREVFSTLCYLSRKGQVNLIVDGKGGFAVRPSSRIFN